MESFWGGTTACPCCQGTTFPEDLQPGNSLEMLAGGALGVGYEQKRGVGEVRVV